MVKQLYNASLLPSESIGSGYSLNVAQGFFEPLAVSAGWLCHLSKGLATKAAHKFMCREQSRKFSESIKDSATLQNLDLWSSTDRSTPYFLRAPFRSWSLKEGKVLKTKLRLNCHSLRCKIRLPSLSTNRSASGSHCPHCPNCPESMTHAICECPSFSTMRDVLYCQIALVDPAFSSLPTHAKLQFILSDISPPQLDAPIYFFLSTLFTAKLVEPTGPGLVSSLGDIPPL
jgi:hypothetical protein